jgi:hypothetical protein
VISGDERRDRRTAYILAISSSQRAGTALHKDYLKGLEQLYIRITEPFKGLTLRHSAHTTHFREHNAHVRTLLYNLSFSVL